MNVRMTFTLYIGWTTLYPDSTVFQSSSCTWEIVTTNDDVINCGSRWPVIPHHNNSKHCQWIILQEHDSRTQWITLKVAYFVE